MNILLFFAGICVLVLAQFAILLLVVRYIRASIYADISAFFIPQEEGKPSEFGKVVNGMADTMAETLFTKMKMAAIGSRGGKADRQETPAATAPGGVLGALAQFFVPQLGSLLGGGGIQLPIDQGNHSSGPSAGDYGSRLNKFK